MMKEKRANPAVAFSDGSGVRGGTSAVTSSDGVMTWADSVPSELTTSAMHNEPPRRQTVQREGSIEGLTVYLVKRTKAPHFRD
jgi:hypothetical protein